MRNWIIAICSSEGKGILLKRFTGTSVDVRKALVALVQEDRNADPDGFDSGTESAEEVELGTENQFDAYQDQPFCA